MKHLLAEKENKSAQSFLSIRQQTLKLCEPLCTEDFVVQPVEDVSPPKWHLGHTTWFFENFILAPHKKNYKVFNDKFNYIFNSYYESVGKRVLRTNRGNLTRPAVEEIIRYREHVDEQLSDFLTNTESLAPQLSYLLNLGLNHEQQHQELLVTDIKYILGNNPLFPEYLKNSDSLTHNDSAPLKENYIEIEEGVYQAGYSGNGFCFDNEKGVHGIFLHSFRLRDRLITNAEYLDFIEAGGYADFRWWLADGWDWVKQNKITAPEYWHKIDNEWHNYMLAGLKKVTPGAPVTHISFYEADAFARWKGKRLPTEYEWEVAASLLNPEIPKQANFLESGNYMPAAPAENNPQLFGDAWEWTNSAYLPYPYYHQEKGALGEYNGKFMVNQMVLRGGSCATPRSHIRHTYRNFFQPCKRWQFTGIRLAEHF